MKYLSIIVSLMLCQGLYQCKSKEIQTDITALHDQLMKVHDETMQQQGESMALIDQLKAFDNHEADKGTMADSIRTELDYSNELMMDWMADYEDPIKQDSVAVHYLRAQIEQMNKISSHMQQNIAAAKKLLGK